MPTSNIDDILLSGKTTTQPSTPEHNFVEVEPEPLNEIADAIVVPEPEKVDTYNLSEDEPEAKPIEKAASEIDDYGNERAAPKTYTEDEVNERINHAVRERFSRMERNQQPQQPQYTQQQVQQASQGFDYNADNPETWQQQLDKYIDHRLDTRDYTRAQQAYEQRERNMEAEFHSRFQEGMKRFPDFTEVVSKQPFTDVMTKALRSFSDPAAFVMAASKRAPKELEKIAGYEDPVKQIVELGKLEERMRQSKPLANTKTPKPIGKIQEDSSIPHSSKQKEPTIEQLIAMDAAKRKAIQDSRRRR